MKPVILIAEDNSEHCELLNFAIDEAVQADLIPKHERKIVTSLEAVIESLKQEYFFVLLLDLSLEDESNHQVVLSKALKNQGKTPMIVLTSFEDHSFGLECVRQGAQDYLFKSDLDKNLLARSISFANERQRLQRELKRSNQDLSTFSAAVSHDLATPIRHITFFANVLLEEEKDLSKKGFDFLENIVKTTGLIGKMTTELLNYAQIGGFSLDHEVDLNEVIENVKNLLKGDLLEENMRIISTNLPKITGNLGKIQQLFLNLISNSIKFRQLEIPAIVEIQAIDSRYSLKLKIKDNGIGIKKGDFKKIFRPFQKSHIASKHSGVGLGLATCKRIVDEHGWTIEITSELEKGTTVTMTIPK